MIRTVIQIEEDDKDNLRHILRIARAQILYRMPKKQSLGQARARARIKLIDDILHSKLDVSVDDIDELFS